MVGKAFIGAGSGFAGDRTDAAGPVVEALATCDGPRFLMFETLAERTLALSQLEYRRHHERGYNPALERFLAPILARCLADNIKIVGNFGAANPLGAAQHIAALANRLSLRAPRIAVVEGDDLMGRLTPAELGARETGGSLLTQGRNIISANLYLGAQPIAQSLDRGADIVVTGRVADSALALGPLMHVFGWRADDWDRLAAGTLAGHLLECGTVIEQLLYEIHDPSAYLAPDVVLDLSEVEIAEIGPNRVRIRGANGKPAPETLKATVCVDGGVLGEAEISYAGPNAAPRGSIRRSSSATAASRRRSSDPGSTVCAVKSSTPRSRASRCRRRPGATCAGSFTPGPTPWRS